ncbi:MAG TPA: cupin domain-containing protein [Parvularculaceae bacterium]|nr:cupin domain-containing protein [Parvularculaceae bacterium]
MMTKAAPKNNYVTDLEEKYSALELVDIPAIVKACKEKWYNLTLCRVDDSAVRVGVIKGEYHWHKHDNDDEFFLTLDGLLLVDLEDRTVELGPWQGITVPKGVLHRTRALERTVILMIERASVIPAGDE